MALQTLGTNLHMVVLSTLQWYCSEVQLSAVDKCLNVTASVSPTSNGFLQFVSDFLRWVLIPSYFKSNKAKSPVAWYFSCD